MIGNLTILQALLCIAMGVVGACVLWKNGYRIAGWKKSIEFSLMLYLYVLAWLFICSIYNRWTGLID